jgi:hypothetical protein
MHKNIIIIKMEEASKHGFELKTDYFKADSKTNGTNVNSEHLSLDELNLDQNSKSSGSKSKRKIHVLSEDEEDGFLADQDSPAPKLLQSSQQSKNQALN